MSLNWDLNLNSLGKWKKVFFILKKMVKFFKNHTFCDVEH